MAEETSSFTSISNSTLIYGLLSEMEWSLLVMEKSPVFSKARASGLTLALKLITQAFPGFADPIDFTNVTGLIGLYRVQSTIVKCFKVIETARQNLRLLPGRFLPTFSQISSK